MSGIDRLSSIGNAALASSGPALDARSVAQGAIGEIGHRVLAWVGASSGSTTGGAAWAEAAGQGSGFRADPGTLARGGDVYGLGDMAREITGSLGGTVTQEGSLRRALEDFTRASVVQLAGLSGAPGDRQVAGVRDALERVVADDAVANGGHGGVDGVIARIEDAAALLSRANG